MKEKITIVIYVEYEPYDSKQDIPSAATQFLGLEKFCYKIAKLFGKVKNRARIRHRMRRELVEEIPDL